MTKFGALSHNCAHDSIARAGPAIQCFLRLEGTQYMGRAMPPPAARFCKMTRAPPAPSTPSRALERSIADESLFSGQMHP